jgi:SAM-dependent methyltransferase
VLKQLFKQLSGTDAAAPAMAAPPPPCVLNVGGGPRGTKLSPQYDAWTVRWLDVDERNRPDILCDARALHTQPAATYDAVYCSHNLEHYHHHQVRGVLEGFRHVLKDDGFLHLRVPDLKRLFTLWAAHDLDLDSRIGDSPRGPILVRDILWGLGVEIEESGRDFYAHKTGFTPRTLSAAVTEAGFGEVFTFSDDGNIEIHAVAFKRAGPSPYKAMFAIP